MGRDAFFQVVSLRSVYRFSSSTPHAAAIVCGCGFGTARKVVMGQGGSLTIPRLVSGPLP